jgi:hypothetical protein
VANNFSAPEEAALKIGSVTFYYFKIRIAALPAMGGSFGPATAIITRNNCTTTPKIARVRLPSGLLPQEKCSDWLSSAKT